MTRSKSIVAALDRLHQVLGADHVGAGLRGLVGLVALGEDGDPDVLAGAGGEGDDAADHLVGVARIDAQVQRDFDRLVELRGGIGLDGLDRLVDAVELLAVDRVGERLLLLGELGHRLSPPSLRGPSRGRSLR